MKKVVSYIISYVLLVSILLSGFGVLEMHKIPELIKHYQVHKQETQNNITVIDFLLMHYKDSSKHKKEENHEELPLFHTCCSASLFLNEPTVLLNLPFYQNISIVQSPINMHYEYAISFSLFQPPRSA